MVKKSNKGNRLEVRLNNGVVVTSKYLMDTYGISNRGATERINRFLAGKITEAKLLQFGRIPADDHPSRTKRVAEVIEISKQSFICKKRMSIEDIPSPTIYDRMYA